MASTLKDHEDICKERYKSILSSLARLENKSKENTKAIQGIEKQLQTGSEIERTKSLEWAAQAAKASEHSWKDEYLCLLFTGIFVLHFFPPLQPYLIRGWIILSVEVPEWFSWCLLVIISGSFGINIARKFLK
jgi:hypothetical protein